MVYPPLEVPHTLARPTSTDPTHKLNDLPMGLLRTQDHDPLTAPSTLDRLIDNAVSFLSAQTVQTMSSTFNAIQSAGSKIGGLVGSGKGQEFYSALLEDLERTPVRCLSWHPYRHVVALVHRENAVRLVDIAGKNSHPPSRLFEGLTHPLQKNITCVAWRPCASLQFAVGVDGGVCLWRVKPVEVGDGGERVPSILGGETIVTGSRGGGIPSMLAKLEDGEATGSPLKNLGSGRGLAKVPDTHMTFLSFPSMTQVTSVTWSPDGTRLCVGCANTPSLFIWDVASESCFPVPAGAGIGTRKVEWSHDGRFLLQVCVGKTLRIQEAEGGGRIEVEASGVGGFRDAVWVDQGKTVAVAACGSSVVRMLSIINGVGGKLEYRMHPQPEKFSKFETYTEGGRTVIAGGMIRSLAVDPKMRRMAVVFDEPGEAGELVALVEIKSDPLPEFVPIGFVRGPRKEGKGKGRPDGDGAEEGEGNAPAVISFAKQYARGALLSVAWSDGRIGFRRSSTEVSEARGKGTNEKDGEDLKGTPKDLKRPKQRWSPRQPAKKHCQDAGASSSDCPKPYAALEQTMLQVGRGDSLIITFATFDCVNTPTGKASIKEAVEDKTAGCTIISLDRILVDGGYCSDPDRMDPKNMVYQPFFHCGFGETVRKSSRF
ncbi:hypothetical protein HDU97_005234 [Phlyctochytrium planicorne]|nr:hypothetical protein HDU97_005234 [Phlyctochytrium planicorne]